MSVAEIREFVRAHPRATAIEIRDGLGQKVESEEFYCYPHPAKGNQKAFFVQDVTRDFYHNLQEFMRADDVEVKLSTIEHLITDGEIYHSRPGVHYTPILISIKGGASQTPSSLSG